MTTVNESVETIGMTLQQIISDNMVLAIASRHITRAKLAEGLGVSGSLVSQKIKGRTSWTIEDMEKAGRYLNIEPAWFLRAHDIDAPEFVGPLGLEPRTGGLLPPAPPPGTLIDESNNRRTGRRFFVSTVP